MMSIEERRARSRANSLRWIRRHPEKKRQCSREWNKRNRDRLLAKQKVWYANNKHLQRDYEKRRRAENPNARNAKDLRTRLWEILKNNISRIGPLWTSRLGTSLPDFKYWLESQFAEGMTWENYGVGGWQIDHITPCCKFDLTKENQICICFNYSNLRPLWEKENQTRRRYQL